MDNRFCKARGDNFARVLRENLSLLRGTERVLARSSLPSARAIVTAASRRVH